MEGTNLLRPDPPEGEGDTFDPEVEATRELAEGMIMPPEDLLGDVGPLAQLKYLGECGWWVFEQWTAMLAAEAGREVDDDDGPARAFRALAHAVGVINYAQSAVGILPPDAATPPGEATSSEVSQT